uniref:Transmembrane domain-containing protein n=1 Tax=Spironucleus salmonicida TaxID=348837 RepID=V6LLX6_9EUKA|eukprot:EST45687.1 Transmembrane domain-containing protein [Spironucleus salmonicida]
MLRIIIFYFIISLSIFKYNQDILIDQIFIATSIIPSFLVRKQMQKISYYQIIFLCSILPIIKQTTIQRDYFISFIASTVTYFIFQFVSKLKFKADMKMLGALTAAIVTAICLLILSINIQQSIFMSGLAGFIIYLSVKDKNIENCSVLLILFTIFLNRYGRSII